MTSETPDQWISEAWDEEDFDDDEESLYEEDFDDDDQAEEALYLESDSWVPVETIDHLEYMPEALRDSEDWCDAYAMGVTLQDTVRIALGQDGIGLSDQDIDALLGDVTREMTPEEAQEFWKSLGRLAKKVGRSVAKVAVKAAPTIGRIAGGAVGAFIGGPAGTAIGSKLGGMAGGALGRLAQRRPSRRHRRRGGRRVRRRAVPVRASSATAQLMRLIQNPGLQQALLGALMGGRGAVRVGESMVEAPFGAFMNALETLATEAAAEMNAVDATTGGLPEYLTEADGTPAVDAASSEDQALRLIELLDQTADDAWNEGWAGEQYGVA